MTPQALAAFSLAQKRLLVATYNEAWRRGVRNYQPGDREFDPVAEAARERDEALLVGAALLVARARRQYVPPVGPDQYRRAIALAPALHGVNSMVGQLATVTPTQDHVDAATAAVADGTIEPAAASRYALHQAVADWVGSNDWRLAGGESAAWAGEQSGFGEAADTGGQLLDWVTDGDDRVCEDCDVLGGMGPMPLEEWPTTPGAGDTECNVGCRCSWDVAAEMPSSDSYQAYPLSSDQQATSDAILGRRSAALDGLAPDMALLS